MLPVGNIISADEGLIYKFKHYRVPDIHFFYNKGRPIDDDLIEYSQKFGFSKKYVLHIYAKLYKPYIKGGKTVCEIWKGTEKVAEGVAYCSYSDNFCYKRGRAIALGRALKELNSK